MKRRNKHQSYKVWSGLVLMCFLLFVGKPLYVEAAASGWDDALSSIDQLYDSLIILETSNKHVKQQTTDLRKQNNDKLKEINKQIQLIDKVKLDKLKTDAEQTQKKHAPLLAQYTDFGKKAAEARKSKNKKSALMYDLKRNRIKASATAARQEIKVKKDALTTAKKQATAKAKIVKDALAPVGTLKKQITEENKRITEANGRRIAADKRYKAAIKQGDAVIAAIELKVITAELSRIQTSQKKVYDWEGNIRNTLRTAEGKLPR